MLTLAEIGPAVYGAWRLAHFDPNGMRYFDRSMTGFWRSFYVSVLVAPLWIIIVAIDFAPSATGGWGRFAMAEIIGYVINWVAFPLASYYLTRFIDRPQEFVGFIVALNWASFIQLGAQVPADLIARSGLLPIGLGDAVWWAVYVALLVYEWFITRTALRLTGFGAIGFVVVDFLISNVVQEITFHLAVLS